MLVYHITYRENSRRTPRIFLRYVRRCTLSVLFTPEERRETISTSQFYINHFFDIAALTRVISKFAQDMPKGKKEAQITSDDIREGLTAVIAIKVSQPQFEGQTKRKLGNSEIAGYVASAFGAKLEEYFQENPAAIPPSATRSTRTTAA